MQGSVMLEASRRSEELRYVTQHFKDLQGLRIAPFWACLALMAWFGMHRLAALVTVYAVVCCLGLQIVFVIAMGRWYRGRYGLIVSPAPSDALDNWWYGPLAFALLGFLVAAFAFRPFHPGLLAMGSFILVALVPRCAEPVPKIGMLVMRRVLYSTALPLVGTMVLWTVFGRPEVRTANRSVSIPLLIVSLYDHWLLDTVLRGASRGLEVVRE